MRDPFEGSGEAGPYVKFAEVGDSVAGKITDVELKEDEYKGEKRTFEDGTPRPVVVLHLELDDGEETRDFVKGRSVSALRKAVHAVEGLGRGPQAGARFTRKRVADAGSGEHMFELTYERDVEAEPAEKKYV